MKKTRSQKAITLVALIITIIVLLILAVVAIRAVTGDGIIAHAKNARTEYERTASEENAMLSNLTEYITGQLGNNGGEDNPPVAQGDWTQNKTEVKNTKTNQMLTVGQTVTNYTAGGKTWKVLGVEEGKLLLMSTTNVKDSHTLQGSTAGWNTAEYRFVGAEAELTQICRDAITDAGEGNSIRSTKVEDINRVTGYNPEVSGNGNPYGKDEIYQYGNEVTYSLNNGKVAYTSDVKSADTSGYSSFTHPDGRKIGENGVESIKVKSSSYSYYPYSLTTSNSTRGEQKGISTDSEAYKLLFKNEADTSNSNYWLASSYANAGGGYASFGVRRVDSGGVYGTILWRSGDGSSGNYYGVRPVVSLKSDFQPIV